MAVSPTDLLQQYGEQFAQAGGLSDMEQVADSFTPASLSAAVAEGGEELVKIVRRGGTTGVAFTPDGKSIPIRFNKSGALTKGSKLAVRKLELRARNQWLKASKVAVAKAPTARGIGVVGSDLMKGKVNPLAYGGVTQAGIQTTASEFVPPTERLSLIQTFRPESPPTAAKVAELDSHFSSAGVSDITKGLKPTQKRMLASMGDSMRSRLAMGRPSEVDAARMTRNTIAAAADRGIPAKVAKPYLNALRLETFRAWREGTPAPLPAPPFENVVGHTAGFRGPIAGGEGSAVSKMTPAQFKSSVFGRSLPQRAPAFSGSPEGISIRGGEPIGLEAEGATSSIASKVVANRARTIKYDPKALRGLYKNIHSDIGRRVAVIMQANNPTLTLPDVEKGVAAFAKYRGQTWKDLFSRYKVTEEALTEAVNEVTPFAERQKAFRLNSDTKKMLKGRKLASVAAIPEKQGGVGGYRIAKTHGPLRGVAGADKANLSSTGFLVGKAPKIPKGKTLWIPSKKVSGVFMTLKDVDRAGGDPFTAYQHRSGVKPAVSSGTGVTAMASTNNPFIPADSPAALKRAAASIEAQIRQMAKSLGLKGKRLKTLLATMKKELAAGGTGAGAIASSPLPSGASGLSPPAVPFGRLPPSPPLRGGGGPVQPPAPPGVGPGLSPPAVHFPPSDRLPPPDRYTFKGAGPTTPTPPPANAAAGKGVMGWLKKKQTPILWGLMAYQLLKMISGEHTRGEQGKLQKVMAQAQMGAPPNPELLAMQALMPERRAQGQADLAQLSSLIVNQPWAGGGVNSGEMLIGR